MSIKDDLRSVIAAMVGHAAYDVLKNSLKDQQVTRHKTGKKIYPERGFIELLTKYAFGELHTLGKIVIENMYDELQRDMKKKGTPITAEDKEMLKKPILQDLEDLFSAPKRAEKIKSLIRGDLAPLMTKHFGHPLDGEWTHDQIEPNLKSFYDKMKKELYVKWGLTIEDAYRALTLKIEYVTAKEKGDAHTIKLIESTGWTFEKIMNKSNILEI